MESDRKNEHLNSGYWPTKYNDLEVAGRTDIGLRRAVNQDHFLIADLHKNLHILAGSSPCRDENLYGSTMGKLLVVADGMGGAQAGEVASELAIETLGQHLLNSMHWLFHPSLSEIQNFLEDLRSAALRSHETVIHASSRRPDYRGMGTTLTVAYVVWPMLYVLHVGDSRCYVLRKNSLQLLTRDQTLAQHLHDCGQLTNEDLERSPYRHVLLSVIGGNDEIPDAAVLKTRLVDGDRVLLCSDGLNAHVSDTEIERILASGKTADGVCCELIELANERGGADNITTMVAISNS